MRGKIQHYNILNTYDISPKEVVCCTCYGATECTCGAAVEVITPKVWIVFDLYYEQVISVHSTEGGADARCFKENEKAERIADANKYCSVEVQEFNLEW